MTDIYFLIVFVTSIIGTFGIGVASTVLYLMYKESKTKIRK
jgi:hypothetical protein